MANSFLPCPKAKRWAHFLGHFERICQTFFTKTHNLKTNPKESGGFCVVSGFLTFCQELLFVFSRGRIPSWYHGRLLSGAENKLLLSSSKAQAGERGSGCLGRKREKHKWYLEDSLSPSFACKLKLCQFMSNPSDWHFALIHHSEE